MPNMVFLTDPAPQLAGTVAGLNYDSLHLSKELWAEILVCNESIGRRAISKASVVSEPLLEE